MSEPMSVTAWADRFALFGDPNRLTLLLILRRSGSINVTELADTSGMRVTSVSHALRLLRAHDLVRSERDGRMVRYALTDHEVNAMLDRVLESTEPGAGLDLRPGWKV